MDIKPDLSKLKIDRSQPSVNDKKKGYSATLVVVVFMIAILIVALFVLKPDRANNKQPERISPPDNLHADTKFVPTSS